MVDRSSETEAVDRVAKAIDEAVAKWQPGSGQRIHEMAARAAIEAFGAAQCPQERLAEAERVIRGVVTSYPVAAGTSKYGFEEDHDGYGSIRECRLYMERFAVADTSTDRGGK